MKLRRTRMWLFAAGIMCFVPLTGCDSIPQDLIDNIIDDVGGDLGDVLAPDLVRFETLATNTGGASGIALDQNGNLYAINSEGLFGPIEEGDDLSQLSPIGAEDLIPDIFPVGTNNLVLAIANSGEFWIGSGGSSILARVPAGGGDATEFRGLLEGGTTGVKSETMAIVPDGFEGAEIKPGNLIVSSEASPTSDRMSAIDVDGDLTVVDVPNPRSDPDNPDFADQRQGHHLTFGLDGGFYGSRGAPALTTFGLQSIATDGTPTDLPGTKGLAAESFVVLENGGFLLRGRLQTSGADSEGGMFWYSPTDGTVARAMSLEDSETSEDDEMVITSDGDIFLALPNRNEIVRVIDTR